MSFQGSKIDLISGSEHRSDTAGFIDLLDGTVTNIGTFEQDPKDPFSVQMSGSSPSASFYMSASGKTGIGTTDPLTDVDVRADKFQIQKQGKRQGVLVNEEGNLESFNSEAEASATGSEFILKYSRGGSAAITSEFLQDTLGLSSDEITDLGGPTAVFNLQEPEVKDKLLSLIEVDGLIQTSSIGDVLGSIRWVSTSGSTTGLDARTAGEAATIQAVVNSSNQFGTSADLLFKVADRAALEGASDFLGAAAAPKTMLRLDGSYAHELTGSLNMGGYSLTCNGVIHSGDTDTKIHFANDNIALYTGNEIVAQAVPSQFLIGDGGDIDFKVVFNGQAISGNNPALFVEGSSGEVGIGTTSPSHKLDVHGNARITGSLIVNGSLTATQITSSIVSSSVIYSSGSNIFGDASGDTHTFNGNIQSNNNLTVASGGTTTLEGPVEMENIKGPNITGPITASNISASGTIITPTITATAGTVGGSAIITANNANENLAGVELGEVTVGTANAATTALTQRSTTNAEFFPVLVDSTNTSATAENLKTPTSGFTFNPSSNITTIGTLTNVNTTHVTASGNISSSGALSTFGEVVHLEGTDPRLKLKAVGANHPGVEWHEDTTRKWVLYNDPDENDNLTFKNNSTELVKISQTGDITASANISASGNLYAENLVVGAGAQSTPSITFTGDLDTGIYKSGTNIMALQAGGGNVEMTINGTTNHIYTNANLSVGSSVLERHITASGNISASGQVFEGTHYHFEVTTRVDTDDDDNWQGPNTKGILTMEDWAQDYGTDYNDTSITYDAARTYMQTGWIIPNGANYSASIKSFDLYMQANTNMTYVDADNFSASLWYSNNSDLSTERNVVDSNSGTFVQRHMATVDSSQCKAADDKFFKYNNYYVSQSINIDLAPGSIIFPRIKSVGTNDFIMNIHWIINYTKIPL